MAPVRQTRRLSGRPMASNKLLATASNKLVPLNDTSATPYRSPTKRKRMGISAQQKQALLDNLQLEVTERARRLRAQYHLQAQGLRSRIEIRINRIPTSLRALTIGELLLKVAEQEKKRAGEEKPPPVPAKDNCRASPLKLNKGPAARSHPARRVNTAMSNETTGDKENEMDILESRKRRPPGAAVADGGRIRPAQVLSPTSSNTRLANRDPSASPTKSHIRRPGSPIKAAGAVGAAAATNLLSSMVEKAKATRKGGPAAKTTKGTRKMTATSESSTASSATATATRGRRPVASKASVPRPATRAGGRASGISETSEGSTNTVIRNAGARKTAVTGTMRKPAMGTTRKGVPGVGAYRPAAKTAAAASAPMTAGGRVLRRRA